MTTQNEIEYGIQKVIKSEKWILAEETRDSKTIQKDITVYNGQTINLVIDIENERILLKNTFTIRGNFGNIVIGTLKPNLKNEFRMFLMPMDIYLQTDRTDPNLDTVHLICCLYFDEFTRNKFYHAMYKLGDIQDPLKKMETDFIDRHRTPIPSIKNFNKSEGGGANHFSSNSL